MITSWWLWKHAAALGVMGVPQVKGEPVGCRCREGVAERGGWVSGHSSLGSSPALPSSWEAWVPVRTATNGRLWEGSVVVDP